MRFAVFNLRPHRHPLLRFGLALAGLALLGFFAAFAVAIAALVLAAFGARRLFASLRGNPSAPAARPLDPGVIEGEFSVVGKSTPLLPR